MATTTRRTRKATTKPADTTELTTTPDPATPTGDQTTGAPDTPADAPVSGAPVSGAPVGSADHFKIVMVAGVLGDHPDGVSAADIADESGLRAAIVGRVLAAMETAGAAARKPTDDASSTELWVRGDGDLTTVSLVAAPTWCECTCGNRHRVRTTVGTRRAVSAAPGQNSDGQRTLGKNELRNIVRDFLREHPGHEFTPTHLGREIGRSSGAVANALAKLVVSGEAVLVREAPATFSAPETATPDTEAPADK